MKPKHQDLCSERVRAQCGIQNYVGCNICVLCPQTRFLANSEIQYLFYMFLLNSGALSKYVFFWVHAATFVMESKLLDIDSAGPVH